MKIFLFLFLFFIFINAQELSLDNLLKKYEKSESLYNKTKKESAGFLLVYSREDLDKMQAYTLKDVMKTVRMYTMQVKPTGYYSIKKAATDISTMTPIKLYIDNFEINSLMQENPLTIDMNMDIYFVDHIEIYQGGSSIAFGNEPGSMVIRLYSKEPYRENSSSSQISVDSKGGVNLRAIDAGVINKYNYLIYADSAKINYDKYERNSKTLSRDATRYQAQFKFSKKDNFDINLGLIVNKSDLFNGFGSAIIDGSVDGSYGYLSATKYFENNLKISLSIAGEQKKSTNSDANGIKLPDNTLSSDFRTDANSNIYKAIVEKKIIDKNSDLLIGTQFQQKQLDIKTYEGQGNISTPEGVDNLNIYMFYLEELYNINKNNLLTFSGKLDFYQPNVAKDTTEYAIRLGYIGHFSKNWSNKIFAIRRYVYPNGMQTSFSPPTYKINTNLISSKINMITDELEYNDNINRLVFSYAYKTIDDAIGFNSVTKQYINKKDRVYVNRLYVRGEHNFDIDNKIVLEYYKAYKDNPSSPASGVLFQLFNKIYKFNIYNEIVYREGYTINYGAGDIKIDDGYDYTLSISYPINKKLDLKLKGENLLDKASETSIDPQGLLKVPAIEQNIMLSMEYTF